MLKAGDVKVRKKRLIWISYNQGSNKIHMKRGQDLPKTLYKTLGIL